MLYERYLQTEYERQGSYDWPADCRLDRHNAAEQPDGIRCGASVLLMCELLALNMMYLHRDHKPALLESRTYLSGTFKVCARGTNKAKHYQ